MTTCYAAAHTIPVCYAAAHIISTGMSTYTPYIPIAILLGLGLSPLGTQRDVVLMCGGPQPAKRVYILFELVMRS